MAPDGGIEKWQIFKCVFFKFMRTVIATFLAAQRWQLDCLDYSEMWRQIGLRVSSSQQIWLCWVYVKSVSSCKQIQLRQQNVSICALLHPKRTAYLTDYCTIWLKGVHHSSHEFGSFEKHCCRWFVNEYVCVYIGQPQSRTEFSWGTSGK